MNKNSALTGVDASDKRRERAAAVKDVLNREFSLPTHDQPGTDRETISKKRIESKIAQLKERFQLPEDFASNFKIPESFKEHKSRQSKVPEILPLRN